MEEVREWQDEEGKHQDNAINSVVSLVGKSISLDRN